MSVGVLMALDAKSYEILSRIIPPGGSGARCDELEDPRYTRTIGNASRLALRLHGRAGDKLQDQASSVAVWHGSRSKCDLNVFKKLLPLRHRKTNDQTS